MSQLDRADGVRATLWSFLSSERAGPPALSLAGGSWIPIRVRSQAELPGTTERRDRQRGDALAAAHEAHALAGRELDVHRAGLQAERLGQARRASSSRYGAELRLLADAPWRPRSRAETGARRACSRTARSSSIESASRQRSSVSGKCWPMSPRPAAPSSASITAWVSTSASRVAGEAALGVRDLHAAEHQRPPVLEPVRVEADPGARAHPSGSSRRARAARTLRAPSRPARSSHSTARSYSYPSCSGVCASLDSATGRPGVEAHLEERRAPGRSRRPACAGPPWTPRSPRRLSAIPSIARS